MKNMRKFLSVILASLVLMSSFAFAVSAEECAHNYVGTSVAPTCVEDGYTLFSCQKCGDSYRDYANGRPATGHHYGEWKTLQEVTCELEGYRQRDCSVCGASEVKTISIVPHKDDNSDGKCDYCSMDMGGETKVSPFDWLIAFFNAIIQFFKDIFA